MVPGFEVVRGERPALFDDAGISLRHALLAEKAARCRTASGQSLELENESHGADQSSSRCHAQHASRLVLLAQATRRGGRALLEVARDPREDSGRSEFR